MAFAVRASEPLAQIEERIRDAYRADESRVVDELLAECARCRGAHPAARERASRMIEQARRRHSVVGDLGDILQEFPLSSDEGIALMGLAEALLRIPDTETIERLIAEKLQAGRWADHVGEADSLVAKVAAQALAAAAGIARPQSHRVDSDVFRRLLSEAATPLVRRAVLHAVRLIGRKFVFSENIDEALTRVRHGFARGYCYSFDMLGEAARTRADAQRYFKSYLSAIHAIGAYRVRDGIGAGATDADAGEALSVSVKLSALHPRLEYAKRPFVTREVAGSLLELARAARDRGIPVTVDAEEAERLEVSLEIFSEVFTDASLVNWDGLGLAIQAYQKRARPVVDWTVALASEHRRRIPVRLVKGAYWDSEIKRAQERGLDGYPVFTRKASTDLSYLACAARLLAQRRAVYPQFATHNALTIATIEELAGTGGGFEFQRLHGMGEALYDPLVQTGEGGQAVRCRVYAPVGTEHDLLAYLVRRLLENGANTSFLNQFADEQVPTDRLLADPVASIERLESRPHPRIPLPRDVFEPERRNSQGIDLTDRRALDALHRERQSAARATWTALPVIAGSTVGSATEAIRSPAHTSRVVGLWRPAQPVDIDEAMGHARAAQPRWDTTPARERAGMLRRAADAIERRRGEFMYLAVEEAGKTVPDAVSEVREAVDYCRYYAVEAERLFAAELTLPAITGERNTLELHGRGVFVCISPWNFPLAIFLGQIAGALAAGNTVLAKPAEQTPLIGALAVATLHEAGIPLDVLHLLPGDGKIGTAMVEHPATCGVAFTGSTETARAINRALARRDGPIVPLIAETGGQNAMIVDASALPEQVVDDVVTSAFRSAGQRCSALRVLCVHEGIADRVLDMLTGAMEELELGDPWALRTDIGPVIDASAREMLARYIEDMRGCGFGIRTLRREEPATGHFFRPHIIEIDSVRRLRGEVFGPVLHFMRFSDATFLEILADITASGYGLTLGIHSRLAQRVAEIRTAVHTGNTYVNRNMIGAVVGAQPFGGEGLSGTGPKAGGPHYLLRFATERTLTVNTTVLGGNASLLSLDD